MKFKRRKPIPHDFVLEELERLRPWTRPMFGCHAVYIENKLVLILRHRESSPEDNGIWLATTVEHHKSLRKDFPNMRSIAIFETEVTGYQVLAESDPGFETYAFKACEFIRRGDPRIGKIPASKTSKSTKSVKRKKR